MVLQHALQAFLIAGVVAPFSYYAGFTARRLRLPQITGYLVSGMICGPYVLGILSQESVSDLNIIEGACLGIIGLAAGAELQVSELYRSKKQVRKCGFTARRTSFELYTQAPSKRRTCYCSSCGTMRVPALLLTCQCRVALYMAGSVVRPAPPQRVTTARALLYVVPQVVSLTCGICVTTWLLCYFTISWSAYLTPVLHVNNGQLAAISSLGATLMMARSPASAVRHRQLDRMQLVCTVLAETGSSTEATAVGPDNGGYDPAI
jgi:hypothetical protein